MLHASNENDPIIEILRLAYRRGLVVLQERRKATMEAMNSDRDGKATDQISVQPERVQAQDS